MVLEITAAVLAFVAVSAVVTTVLGGVTVSRAVEQRLGAWNRQPVIDGGLRSGDVLRRGASSLPFLRSFLSRSAWSERAATDLQRAGLRLKVGEYLLLRLLLATLAALGTVLLIRSGLTGLLLACPTAVLGFTLPAWYVRLRKERRTAAIDGQLVEMLHLVSNALRSGFAFSQAIEMAAKQLAPPLRDELNHLLRDNALGARTEDALRDLAARAGSYDLDMVVTAILIQRTTGGNLSEVLDNVSETIRERDRIRGEVRSLTSHQRLTGQILAAYPVFLALIFFLISPSLMSILWTDAVGRVLLVAAGSLQLLGALIIRRILNIDI